MSRLVSQSEFAKRAGVSRQLISSIIKDGNLQNRLIIVEQGNKKLIDTASLENFDKNKDHSKDTSYAKTKIDKKKTASETKITIDADGYTQADLNLLKTKTAVQIKQVELSKERGELVERSLIESILPSLLTSFTTQAKNLPTRVSPIIAAKIKDRFNLEIIESEIEIIIKHTLEDDIKKMTRIIQADIKYKI